MEVLEIADLEALFAGSTVDISEQRIAVREAVRAVAAISPQEEAKARLERLIANPTTRANLPRWMIGGKHEELAIRLMMDPMFVNGYMQSKSFSLKRVQEHYKRHDTMKK